MKLGMNKTFLSVLAMGVYGGLLLGSAGAPPRPVEPLKIGNYDFTPSPIEKPGSAKITFALVNPNFVAGFQFANAQTFKDFVKGMQKDFEEVLIARGYSLRGPFPSRDEMVYSDKEQSDLALTVETDIEINPATPQPWSVDSNAYSLSFQYKGILVLSGKVSLKIFEPTTGEVLQVKSINLPQKGVEVQSIGQYKSPMSASGLPTYQELDKSYTGRKRVSLGELLGDSMENSNLATAAALNSTGIPTQDAGINNPLTTALEDCYRLVMQTAWNHLDVSEMRVLQKQAQDIKKKAQFKR